MYSVHCPVWTALLSLTFVNAAAQCFHQFRCDRERAYLLLGLAAGAVALGLCSVFLIKGEAALTMGRLVAFGVLYYMLRALAGLLFVGVLLAMFWIAHRVGHLDGEQWEAYFQSVSTVGLLLRGCSGGAEPSDGYVLYFQERDLRSAAGEGALRTESVQLEPTEAPR